MNIYYLISVIPIWIILLCSIWVVVKPCRPCQPPTSTESYMPPTHMPQITLLSSPTQVPNFGIGNQTLYHGGYPFPPRTYS